MFKIFCHEIGTYVLFKSSKNKNCLWKQLRSPIKFSLHTLVHFLKHSQCDCGHSCLCTTQSESWAVSPHSSVFIVLTVITPNTSPCYLKASLSPACFTMMLTSAHILWTPAPSLPDAPVRNYESPQPHCRACCSGKEVRGHPLDWHLPMTGQKVNVVFNLLGFCGCVIVLKILWWNYDHS